MIKKADLLALAKDRIAIMLFLAITISVVIIILVTLLRLHPSDVQIPVRYSAFGTANIYRDQWYILYIFPVFALLAGVFNVIISVKLYSLGRLASIGFMGMTLFLLLTGLVVTNAILNLAPSV